MRQTPASSTATGARRFHPFSLAQGLALAAAALLLAACGGDAPQGRGAGPGSGPGGGPGAGPGGGRAPVAVKAVPVETATFQDRIEAIGTGYANEAVTVSANVTERIERIYFKDGETVRRGDVLAELSRREENASLNEARARLREAEAQLARLKQLAKSGFATDARIDEQTALRDSARAALTGIEAQLADRVIRAPFGGVVGLRRVSPGLIVTAGTTIAEIRDLSKIKLDFTVPEVFLGGLETGQTISVTAAPYPNEAFAGTIDSIDPQIDPVTRAITVRAVLDNADRKLRPGMLLTVVLESLPREAMVVPEQAIVPRLDRKYVYRVNAGDMRASLTEVMAGGRKPGYVEILDGLSVGDLVVTEGVIKLRDGATVRLLEDAAAAQSPALVADAPQPGVGDALQ